MKRCWTNVEKGLDSALNKRGNGDGKRHSGNNWKLDRSSSVACARARWTMLESFLYDQAERGSEAVEELYETQNSVLWSDASLPETVPVFEDVDVVNVHVMNATRIGQAFPLSERERVPCTIPIRLAPPTCADQTVNVVVRVSFVVSDANVLLDQHHDWLDVNAVVVYPHRAPRASPSSFDRDGPYCFDVHPEWSVVPLFDYFMANGLVPTRRWTFDISEKPVSKSMRIGPHDRSRLVTIRYETRFHAEVGEEADASTGVRRVLYWRDDYETVPRREYIPVQDGSVTRQKLADDAVGTSVLIDGSVTNEKIANDSVSTDQLRDGAVVLKKLGADVYLVEEGRLASDMVGVDSIKDRAVTSAKLALESVQTAHIGTGQVTADKIATGAVGNIHLASDAVGRFNLMRDSIQTSHIAPESVTLDKLEPAVRLALWRSIPNVSNQVVHLPNDPRIGSLAIGDYAGAVDQHSYSVALGASAGRHSQQNHAIAIGPDAGRCHQGASAIALGNRAGSGRQSGTPLNHACEAFDSDGCMAVDDELCEMDGGACNDDDEYDGENVGNGQSRRAIAIGMAAGSVRQGSSAIAIGAGAGRCHQSECAIAIGARAGEHHQGSQTIVLNATGESLDTPSRLYGQPRQAGGTFVKPIRQLASRRCEQYGTPALSYDAHSGEIVQQPSLHATIGGLSRFDPNTLTRMVTLPREFCKVFKDDEITVTVTGIANPTAFSTLEITEVLNGSFEVRRGASSPGVSKFYWMALGHKVNASTNPCDDDDGDGSEGDGSE